MLSGPGGLGDQIDGEFVDAVSGAPTAVVSFTLDVGYIDNRDSTEVVAFDANGDIVQTVVAQDYGINTLTLTYAGIASFEVLSTSQEDAGFGIDNLSVDPGGQARTIRTMASMGDSYSSGEGLLEGKGLSYDCGTDMSDDVYFQDTTLPYRWGQVWPPGWFCDTRTLSAGKPNLAARPPTEYDNTCHRHGQAYPVDISRTLKVTSFIFVACSGATTDNIGAIPSTATPQHPRSPLNVAGGNTQIVDVQNFTSRIGGDPDLITIGVGGNDAEFASIVKHCIGSAPIAPCGDNADFRNAAIDKIDGEVYDKLTETFTTLRFDFPDSTIVAFGYVDPVSESAGTCGSAPVSGDDLPFLGAQLIGALNQAVADAADTAGVAYVDPASVTAGHELCTSDSWFRGLSLGGGSFHPTQVAHQQIAAWFAAHYTDGAGRLLLHNPSPASDPIRPSPSGSPATIVPIHAHPPLGGCLQGCAVELQGSGYTPGATGEIVLHSAAVDLGPFTADSDGNVDIRVTIPAGTPIGPHIITMDGTGADGSPQFAAEELDVVPRPSRRPLHFRLLTSTTQNGSTPRSR